MKIGQRMKVPVNQNRVIVNQIFEDRFCFEEGAYWSM